MSSRDDDVLLSPAGEAFAEYLALYEDGVAPEFEDFCEQHPELAGELKVLHGGWAQFVAPMGGQPAEDPSSSESLAEELLNNLKGTVVDGERYEDRGAVGRGGMGEVRAVYDTSLRRMLAMKVLLGAGESKSSRGLVRFLDEARISAQLDHPGIVPVHELGLDASGRVYFTMPLIRGRDLGEIYGLCREGGSEWGRARVLSSLLRVCEAVSFAHSRGVLHRDLKPANVMVGPFGETYVMDWGLAKVIGAAELADERPALDTDRATVAAGSSDSALLTEAGAVVGTPAYLAPEQAAGGAIDERVDVYSIGSMLYELLAGQKPYESGDRLDADLMLAALAMGPPEPLSAKTDDVPPELEAICERAMAWSANDRYPSVAALGDDLRAFLEGRVVEAYKTGAVAELRKWVTRNRTTASAVFAAAFLAVAGLIGIGWSEASRRAQVEEKNTELELARQEEARQAGIARTRTEEVLRLSDFGLLGELEQRSGHLWPLDPDRIDDIDEWIADASDVRERGIQHRATLESLRERALPYTAEQRAEDEKMQDHYEELVWYRENYQERTSKLEEFYARRAAGDASDPLQENIRRWEESVEFIESKLAPLEAKPLRRLTWEFSTKEAQWEHDTLAGLVERLDALEAPDGWFDDIRLRRSEVERVLRDSLESDVARDAWAWAIDSIGDPYGATAYRGLVIEPQFGLFPIGPDPQSELWEFAHVQSGTVAERDPRTGELEISDRMGVVLVLIPGGTYSMGAQAKHPGGQHYDPVREKFESPTHQVVLDPFFISKFEFTQGQWLRARGSNPANLRSGRSSHTSATVGPEATLLSPVETVSWSESFETMRRLGLVLPSEAQWEIAARATTGTPWYTGMSLESLEGHANLADRSLRNGDGMAAGKSWLEWLDDGVSHTAPIGSFAPNPFGLHDVFGNVGEWVLDEWTPYSNPPDRGTGLRRSLLDGDHIARGGSFLDVGQGARASAREPLHGDPQVGTVGLRPARYLESSR